MTGYNQTVAVSATASVTPVKSVASALAVGATASVTPKLQQFLTGPLTDALTVKSPFPYPFAALGLELSQNLTVHGANSEAMIWGRLIAETVKLSLTQTPQMKYAVRLTHLIKVAQVLQWAWKLTLSHTIDISLTQHAALGLTLLQNLKVLPTVSPEAVYHLALSQDFSLSSALGRFIGATITQALTVAPAQIAQYRGFTTLIQDLTLAGVLANSLHLSIVDTLDMTDAEVLQAIFTDTLADTVNMLALYVSPSGFATTWAVNTRTNAITEYQNYAFTGFAQMGRKYIGTTSTGLYELDGALDGTASIIAELETGFLQMAGTRLSGLKGLYLGMDTGLGSQGLMYVKIVDGFDNEYVYQVAAQPGLGSTKINIGKGLRARYLSFNLTSTGPDFRLDTIEFVPMRSDRRV